MQVDLLKDPPRKLFFQYLIPSVSATMVTSIYVLADSIMIGKGLGEIPIAALNLVLPIFNVLFGTGALFGVGGAVLFSVSMGNKDQHELAVISRWHAWPTQPLCFSISSVAISGWSPFCVS